MSEPEAGQLQSGPFESGPFESGGFQSGRPLSVPSGFEDLARTALLEVTDPQSVGPLVSETDEGDGVVSLRFESNLSGYLGWKWTVSVAKVGDDEPTVLESELMPGDGALLAPEWVPWSDRLDEYNAGRAAAADGEADDDTEDDDDLGDDDEDLIDEEDLEDDELVDDDLEDDDLGDDEYDGVDAVLEEADEDDLLAAADSDEVEMASDAAAVGVDEAEQAEEDAGRTRQDEVAALDSDEAAETEERADEGE
jgi:hypothetical protein